MITKSQRETGRKFGTKFPKEASSLSRWFGKSITTLSGFLFAAATSVARSFRGWWGRFPRAGSLRVGLMVPLIGGLIMLAFYLTHSSVRAVQTSKSAASS